MSGRPFSLEGIEVLSFQKVLLEVMARIDRQNYGDPVTRTIQLMRFALLNHPEHLAKLLRQVYPVRKQALLLKHLAAEGLSARAKGLLSELVGATDLPEGAPEGQQTLSAFLSLVAEKKGE